MFIVGKSFFSEMLSKFDINTIAPLSLKKYKLLLTKSITNSLDYCSISFAENAYCQNCNILINKIALVFYFFKTLQE